MNHSEWRVGWFLPEDSPKGGGNDNAQDHTADDDHDFLLRQGGRKEKPQSAHGRGWGGGELLCIHEGEGAEGLEKGHESWGWNWGRVTAPKGSREVVIMGSRRPGRGVRALFRAERRGRDCDRMGTSMGAWGMGAQGWGCSPCVPCSGT